MKWISVKDRLPEEDKWILIGSTQSECVETGILMDGKFVLPDHNYLERTKTTHWMPLPESPKEITL